MISTAGYGMVWDEPQVECHGLDTPEMVRFYEHDFYPFSNFSAFTIQWKGLRFDTSEHVYHWEKFPHEPEIQRRIHESISAHEAFKYAQDRKEFQHPNWLGVRVNIMADILRAKVRQHEYVKRKLLATGNRTLVEDSWRDNYWGWGPNQDGENMLGKLWMIVRSEIRVNEARD